MKKLLIVVDMEGISGIGMDEYWSTIKGHPLYFLKRHLLVKETNVVIEGAMQAGLKAKEIVVVDWHLSHHNLKDYEVPTGVEIIRDNEHEILEKGIERVFLVGFHARAGLPIHYAHTFIYAIKSFKIGKQEVGETTMWAYVAGSLNMPIVLLTGDSYAVEEIKVLEPRCICVTNKTQKETYSLEVIYKKVREAAMNANIRSIKPVISPRPFSIRFSFKSLKISARISQVYVTRQEEEFFVIEGADACEVYVKLRRLLMFIRTGSLGLRLLALLERSKN